MGALRELLEWFKRDPGLWSGEKTLTTGNLGWVELVRIPKLPYPQPVTLQLWTDTETDLAFPGPSARNRAKVQVDVGVGRMTHTTFLGGPHNNRDWDQTIVGVQGATPIARACEVFTCETMLVRVQADPTSQAATFTARAVAGLGAAPSRAVRELESLDSVVTAVAQSAATVAIVKAEHQALYGRRRSLMVYNDAAATLFLRFGTVAASLVDYSVPVPAGALYEVPFPTCRGPVQGIWAAAGAGNARVTELIADGDLGER